jgi:hypothetical protein
MLRYFGRIYGFIWFTLFSQGYINNATCAEIAAGITLDCDYPLVGGVKDDLYLFNYSHLNSVTRNSTNPQIIEAITLTSGKKVYKFEGKNNSVEPRAALVKQRYADAYEHQVDFLVFSLVPASKAIIEDLVKGRVIAICENRHREVSGKTSFEIYGLNAGLEVSELERVANDSDTQGAYKLVLKTSEYSREPALPNTLFKTDYATSKALITALL